MENEIWVDVPGYVGIYQASTQGNIRSVDRPAKSKTCPVRDVKGVVLKQKMVGKYLGVNISKSGKPKSVYVHRMIGFSFLNLTKGMEINHKNGITTDNRLQNLEVCTRSENAKHKYRVLKAVHPFLGRCGKLNVNSRQIEKVDPKTGDIVSTYESLSFAQKEGYNYTCISECCNGSQKTHRGFIWRHSLKTA